jgi:hypothetical protein
VVDLPKVFKVRRSPMSEAEQLSAVSLWRVGET